MKARSSIPKGRSLLSMVPTPTTPLRAILDNLDKDPATDSFEDDLDETEDVTKEFEPYHKGTDIEGQ